VHLRAGCTAPAVPAALTDGCRPGRTRGRPAGPTNGPAVG